MNTLTHALIGAAVFGRPRLTLGILSATLAGGAFPDVSILVMVFWEMGLNGTSEAELWNEAYFQEPWITYSAISNSFVVFGLLALLAWISGWSWLMIFALTAMLHFAGDIFLHHDDGRPHFWPLSQCVYYSPLSYWDPNHGGLWWTGVEMLMSAALGIWVWRHADTWWARTYTGLLVGLFWLMSVAFLAFFISAGGTDDRPESSDIDRFARPACPGSIDVARHSAQIVS